MWDKSNNKHNISKGFIMKLSDINPHIRYASVHYYHMDKPLDSICYDCRLFFMKEGKGHVIANGTQYLFANNTALFLPAGTRYHIYPDKSCNSFITIVINFDLVNAFSHLQKSLGTASEKTFIPEKLITYPMPTEFASVLSRKIPSIAPLLDKCCEEFLIQNSLYREVSSSLLKFCLLDLVRTNEQNQEFARVLPVLDYIHENYPDPTLTNESIAKLFNYHPYYLSQMVRQYTGQSLHQYLIAYRIKMAKKKLITTNDPISTVAWKSGFQSPAYFIKQFKAHVGVTPYAYRKEHMNFLF